MKKRYRFSEKLISTIVVNAGGFLSPSALDKLITDFENEAARHVFTETSETNLLRIFNSIFEKGAFFTDCSRYPHFIEIVTAIASYSNFLTDIIVRNPEFIYLTLKENFLTDALTREELNSETEQGKKRHAEINGYTEYLKFVQRKFIFKIGLRDILNFTTLKKTTEEISTLAFGISSSLFDFILSAVFRKYELSPDLQKHVIIALGKMGGNELNYSSDIDLIAFFDKNDKLQNGKEYFEILNEAIQLFAKQISGITNGGFLYRVDFRLRPDGKFSPLARTLNDTMLYYETRGELWEKQMLIKASYVNGNKELYNKFAHFKNLYSFGQAFSVSPLKTIREMKYKIEQNYNDDTNVKTFWGGIRDIEFSVQALQLINGHKSERLKTPNTLEALAELKYEHILTNDEYSILKNAYIFFRRAEHFLQLSNNTQTHIIPNDNETVGKLAAYLNLNSAKEFRQTLLNHREQVRNIFNSIFKINDEDKTTPFDKINFENKRRAKKNIEYLRTGSGLSVEKSFDSKTIELFKRIEPVLISYLLNSNAPDKVLENFVKLTSTASFQSILYSELTNKVFFEKVLTVCEFSQIAVDLLGFDKSLIDLLLSRQAFTDISRNNKFDIPIVKLKFILALQYALDLIDENTVSQLLSSFFAHKTREVLKEQNLQYDYFVGGLGSFGIGEMNFFSDIDLIVVVKKLGNRKKMEEDFQSFLEAVRKVLPNTEIDFRLRPEGKNSMLVWDLANYEKYFSDRAEYWEFQTLFKLNFIGGDEKLFADFENLIIAALNKRSAVFTSDAIKKMHDKSIQHARTLTPSIDLKKNLGGFLTVDYTLSAFIHNDIDIAKKIMGKNNSEKIDILSSRFTNYKAELKLLALNYKTMKYILLKMQNYYNAKGYKISRNKNDADAFAKFSGYDNFGMLQQKLMELTKSNYKLFLSSVASLKQ